MSKTKVLPKAGEKQYNAGRMSNVDIAFIHQNYNKLSVEQIQNRIPKRSIVQIQREVDKCNDMSSSLPSAAKPPSTKKVNQSVAERLRLRPDWKRWERQFLEDELEQFVTKYVELIGQFSDLTTTEEMQVFSLITNEILIDRVMDAKKRIIEDKIFSQALLDNERARPIKSQNMDLLDKLQVDIDTLKAQDKELSNELKIFDDQRGKAMQSLKATRDQRFKVSQDSSKSFKGVLDMLANEDDQKRIGEEMIMAAIAAESEKRRLGMPHKYEDGQIDRPILSHETIDLEEDDEET